MESNERILCAAIWIDDLEYHEHQPKNIPTGFVIAGRRHHNAMYTASLIDNPKIHAAIKRRDSQGFLTSWDRYVNRSAALVIAKREGQMAQPDIVSEELISEDLY